MRTQLAAHDSAARPSWTIGICFAHQLRARRRKSTRPRVRRLFALHRQRVRCHLLRTTAPRARDGDVSLRAGRCRTLTTSVATPWRSSPGAQIPPSRAQRTSPGTHRAETETLDRNAPADPHSPHGRGQRRTTLSAGSDRGRAFRPLGGPPITWW